ncbi:MAG: TIGR03943 family protein [Anaerolineae bacterium]|nr:TIGR03943 family protein [Anaerolineae bacterium]
MEAAEHLHEHDHNHEHGVPVQEILKTALLIGLGLYFVVLIATGSLTNYINVRFSWLSYVAALIFLLLGATSAVRLMQSRRHDHHPHEHQHDHDPEHGSISWAALAVIAVPLVLGTLIPSRPLGAAAVDSELSANNIGGDVTAAFNIPPEQRNILDWVRALNAAEDPATLNGQTVDVVGFVYRGEAYTSDQFLVARFTISCCVADAVAIGLPVAWPEDLPLDAWVRVRGQFVPGDFQGETRPVIQPTRVELVEQPEHPYLYP